MPYCNRLPASAEQLQLLLLDCLRLVAPAYLPGFDGITVERILHSYGGLAARGLVPGCAQLVDRHPELSIELDAFFAEENLN